MTTLRAEVKNNIVKFLDKNDLLKDTKIQKVEKITITRLINKDRPPTLLFSIKITTVLNITTNIKAIIARKV
jgi:hypothetical protein